MIRDDLFNILLSDNVIRAFEFYEDYSAVANQTVTIKNCENSNLSNLYFTLYPLAFAKNFNHFLLGKIKQFLPIFLGKKNKGE